MGASNFICFNYNNTPIAVIEAKFNYLEQESQNGYPLPQKGFILSDWKCNIFKQHYTSSSFNNIFGIPSLKGNFRPVSGHTKSPFITSISNNT